MSESETRNVWKECEENSSRVAYTATLTALGVVLLLGTALGFLTNLGWFYSFIVGFYIALLPFVGYQVVTWLLEV